MQAIPHNKILNTTAPEISKTEQALPHYTRRLLAQLRSNKSPILHEYLHKITPETHPAPNCPLCHTQHQTSSTAQGCRPTWTPRCCGTILGGGGWRGGWGGGGLWRRGCWPAGRTSWGGVWSGDSGERDTVGAPQGRQQQQQRNIFSRIQCYYRPFERSRQALSVCIGLREVGVIGGKLSRK